MNKKGQVLLIILWILIILTVLAVRLGQDVSLILKLAASHTSKLKSYSFAKAGVSLAVKEIGRYDKQPYSWLNDAWADNEKLFKKFCFAENNDEFASVNYLKNDGTSAQKTVYGVSDEESKINLNTAPLELLVNFLKELGMRNPEQLADNICAWRGDKLIMLPDYGDLGYTNKGELFSSIEELILVKDVTGELYAQIRDFVTVYGPGKININTCSLKILRVLMQSASADNVLAEKMAGAIIQFRIGADMAEGTSDDCKFQDTAALAAIFTDTDSSSVINQVIAKDLVTVKSDYFRIKANGFSGKASTEITVIYNSKDNKTVYYHEN